jgi:hypothetical protein
MSEIERPSQKLPEGYHLDESDTDIVVLYCSTEIVGRYNARHVTMETLVSDAEKHMKQKVESKQEA